MAAEKDLMQTSTGWRGMTPTTDQDIPQGNLIQ